MHVKLFRKLLACDSVALACFESVRKGALLHVIPITKWSLQLRFHLWLHLIQSSPASRWCCALLGIFSFDELTFELLLRVSAPSSVCQYPSGTLSPFICRNFATVCKGREERRAVGKEEAGMWDRSRKRTKLSEHK